VTIDVTGLGTVTGAKLRWLTITPWVGARFQTHISIPGGKSLGRTYDRGADNKVATLVGLISWNDYGEAVLDSIGGKILTVDNGAGRSAVRAIANAPQIIDAVSKAVIKFSVTLTEVEDTGEDDE